MTLLGVSLWVRFGVGMDPQLGEFTIRGNKKVTWKKLRGKSYVELFFFFSKNFRIPSPPPLLPPPLLLKP